MTAVDQQPQWVQQFDRLLPMKTQIVIYGNIYDRVPVLARDAAAEDQFTYLNLRDFLRNHLTAAGYRIVGFYDIVDGLQFENQETLRAFESVLGAHAGPEPRSREPVEGGAATDAGRPGATYAAPDPARAFAAIRKAMSQNKQAAAIVVDFASRLVSAPERLPADERGIFIRLTKCAGESARLRSGTVVLNNLTVLVCDKLNDLPTWMFLNNPLLGSVAIDAPSEAERRAFFTRNRSMFPGVDADLPDPARWVDTFVGSTSGLRHQDLLSLQILANSHKHEVRSERDIRALIDLYKFGVKDNPWENLDVRRRERFCHAAEVLRARVKGQDRAISAVETMLKRAAMGMSGVQQSRSQKPRGVLFFAGPTGVGKTEMAKALAELVFNDQSACIRFDMSEYGTSHSDQKLMGAPPGYVGYQEGGQLTNRIRTNPFSVLLFDEIEKADPSILDKFLQILEDGRMTDGRGETVYFSEAIIIFTSNLGTYVRGEGPEGGKRRANVRPHGWRCENPDCVDRPWLFEDRKRCPSCDQAMLMRQATPYEVVEERMLKAIRDEFTINLGRPELLNRFGNNFIVFDYIRTDVLRQIVEMNLDRLRRDLADRRKLKLEIASAVVEKIVGHLEHEDNEMGARGVVSYVETVLVNPLAGELFDRDVQPGSRIIIEDLVPRAAGGHGAGALRLRCE